MSRTSTTGSNGVLSRQSINTGLSILQPLQGNFKSNFGSVIGGLSSTYSLTNALNGTL